ncbi:MAG: polymerase [Thermosediminibacterales bacterium]|nr:polymerase [Thermosediminibacterales bacterium]
MNEIADYMEILGENIYKIAVYRKASKIIKELKQDIQDILKEDRLREIPGIGKALEAKIKEIIETGRCAYHRDLKKQIPEDLLELLKIPGLGGKKIRVIYENLKVKNIDELKAAAEQKKIRDLPGMGAKTELNILKGIKMLEDNRAFTILGIALPIAESIIDILKRVEGVEEIEITGEIRRKREMVRQIELLALTENPHITKKVFKQMPGIKEVLEETPNRCSIFLDVGIKVDLEITKERNEFISALYYSTGSDKHIAKMVSIAGTLGYRILKNEIIDIDDKKITVEKEQDVFDILNMPYIIPELREDRGEVEAALEGELPKVIDIADIKGDLHIHSNWSDGINTIEEIAQYARDLGYKYIAITDHSKSLAIAKGLTERKLLKQIEEIKGLNSRIKGISVLSGIEVDILMDGTLDYPDNILKELDIVIASVHTGFKQDKFQMTNRIIKAMNNRYVNIIAHPTGRLLGKRQGYEVIVDEVLKEARENNIILEINASPDRLDLNDILARKAKEMGIKMAVNTDAHEVLRLEEMRYGVFVAKRAWLENKDIINTYPLNDLLNLLKIKKV